MSAVGANVHSADELNCFGPALSALHTASCTLTPSLLSRLLGLAHIFTPSVPASCFSPIVCPDPVHHSRSVCGCTSIGQPCIIGDQGLPLFCACLEGSSVRPKAIGHLIKSGHLPYM